MKPKFANTLVAAVVTLGATTAAHATPVFQATQGFLTGISGVDIGSKNYDVQFVDGSCIGVFGNVCKNTSNEKIYPFTFKSASTAQQAETILEILLSTTAYRTDGNIGNSYGQNVFVNNIITPYLLEATNIVKFKSFSVQNSISVNYNISTDIKGSYAVWQEAPTSVPEPSSAATLAVGVIALMAARRRRRLPGLSS
jgi:hypothetical protein